MFEWECQSARSNNVPRAMANHPGQPRAYEHLKSIWRASLRCIFSLHKWWTKWFIFCEKLQVTSTWPRAWTLIMCTHFRITPIRTCGCLVAFSLVAFSLVAFSLVAFNLVTFSLLLFNLLFNFLNFSTYHRYLEALKAIKVANCGVKSPGVSAPSKVYTG